VLHKVVWGLRWATATAIGLTTTILIVAVAFALLGFRKTAERINDAVLYALSVDLTLVALLVVAFVVTWLIGGHKGPPQK